MLFDLRGKRRRVIQVIYAALAVLMGGGLILFGIGGDVSGGLLDGLGVGSQGGAGGDTGFEDEIEDAEKRLQTNPQDTQALLDLVKLNYSAGNQQLEVDEATGQPVGVSTEAEESYQRAADAWDRYLALEPKQPDSGAASSVSQAYFYLAVAANTAVEAKANLTAAAEAERVVAQQTPEVGPLTALARYLYLAGDTAAAEQAKQQALAAAGPQRDAVIQQLKLAEQQGQALAEEAKKLAQAEPGAQGAAPGGANPLQDPSGALGGEGLGGLGGGARPAP